MATFRWKNLFFWTTMGINCILGAWTLKLSIFWARNCKKKVHKKEMKLFWLISSGSNLGRSVFNKWFFFKQLMDIIGKKSLKLFIFLHLIQFCPIFSATEHDWRVLERWFFSHFETMMRKYSIKTRMGRIKDWAILGPGNLIFTSHHLILKLLTRSRKNNWD